MTMSCEIAGVHATATVLSSHRTSQGTVSYVRCHCGTTQVVLARAWSRDVVELRHAA